MNNQPYAARILSWVPAHDERSAITLLEMIKDTVTKREGKSSGYLCLYFGNGNAKYAFQLIYVKDIYDIDGNVMDHPPAVSVSAETLHAAANKLAQRICPQD